jgi:hypothetical protein
MFRKVLLTTILFALMSVQAIAGVKNAVSVWELNDDKGETATDSIGKNNGVIHNARWIKEGNGTALYFNGDNSYISVNDPGNNSALDISGELGLEVNLKLESYFNKKTAATGSKTDGANQMILVKTEYPNKVNYSLSVFWGKLLFIADLQNGSKIRLAGSTHVPLMKWATVTVVCDGTEAKLLLDGREEARQAYSGKLAVNNSPILIGGYHDNYKSESERLNYRYAFFQGVLGKISLFNSADVISATGANAGSNLPPTMTKVIPLKAKVENRNGVPVLSLGDMTEQFLGFRDEKHLREISLIGTTQRFLDKGIKFHFLLITPAGRAYQKDKMYAELDKCVLDALREASDCYFIVYVNTDIRTSTEPNWLKQHPDEVIIWPPNMIKGDRASMASIVRREEVAGDLSSLVKHIRESPYSDRIAGYFMNGGAGEWGDYWDYSRPAQEGFKKWVKDNYKNDLALLRKSWKDDKADFATVKIPEWKELFTADTGVFHDPAISRRKIDFLQYHHEMAADTALYFAKAIKDASNNESLVGLWNGYIFLPEWWQDSTPYLIVNNRRMNMFSKLLDSPYIDFIGSPYSYQERHPGGGFVPQFPADSIILHNKLALTEDDTRTHLATPHVAYGAAEQYGDYFGKARNMQETLAVLKRNFAGVFSKPGSGLYYVGMGSDGNKWFDDPSILDTVSRFVDIAEKTKARDRNASQIAVIISFRSFFYQKFNNMSRDFILRQTYENLTRLGAPYDVYLDSDITSKNFPFDRYKMYVFLNSFYLPAQERSIIKEKICRNNNTVVWVYASGFASDNELSLEALSDITGIKMGMYKGPLSRVQCEITEYSHPLTASLPTNLRYGSEGPMEPVFWCDDPQATVLGKLLSTTDEGKVYTFRKPGLSVKKLNGWISVWSGTPNIPSGLLRNIAAQAGVHIYDAGDDQVFASEKLLAVHTKYAGERVIKLPRKCNVFDPFKGKYIAKDTRQFTVNIPAAATEIWIME